MKLLISLVVLTLSIFSFACDDDFDLNKYLLPVDSEILPVDSEMDLDRVEKIDKDLIVNDTSNLPDGVAEVIGATLSSSGIASAASVMYWVHGGPYFDVRLYKYHNGIHLESAKDIFREADFATEIENPADLAFNLDSEYGERVMLFINDFQLSITSTSDQVNMQDFNHAFANWIRYIDSWN